MDVDNQMLSDVLGLIMEYISRDVSALSRINKRIRRLVARLIVYNAARASPTQAHISEGPLTTMWMVRNCEISSSVVVRTCPIAMLVMSPRSGIVRYYGIILLHYCNGPMFARIPPTDMYVLLDIPINDLLSYVDAGCTAADRTIAAVGRYIRKLEHD